MTTSPATCDTGGIGHLDPALARINVDDVLAPMARLLGDRATSSRDAGLRQPDDVPDADTDLVVGR
jgi:hypothetical protein